MTELQKKYVRDIEEEIRQQPGGQQYTVYMSNSIVRIQNTETSEKYRLYAPGKGDGKKVIRMKMLKLFREMHGGAGNE